MGGSPGQQGQRIRWPADRQDLGSSGKADPACAGAHAGPKPCYMGVRHPQPCSHCARVQLPPGCLRVPTGFVLASASRPQALSCCPEGAKLGSSQGRGTGSESEGERAPTEDGPRLLPALGPRRHRPTRLQRPEEPQQRERAGRGAHGPTLFPRGPSSPPLPSSLPHAASPGWPQTPGQNLPPWPQAASSPSCHPSTARGSVAAQLSSVGLRGRFPESDHSPRAEPWL